MSVHGMGVGGMHWGWEACIGGGGMCGGEYVWKGGQNGRGACMAGAKCGEGACVEEKMAIAAGSMHPTGMHSCF